MLLVMLNSILLLMIQEENIYLNKKIKSAFHKQYNDRWFRYILNAVWSILKYYSYHSEITTFNQY